MHKNELDFLVNLAEYTHTPLTTLVDLAQDERALRLHELLTEAKEGETFTFQSGRYKGKQGKYVKNKSGKLTPVLVSGQSAKPTTKSWSPAPKKTMLPPNTQINPEILPALATAQRVDIPQVERNVGTKHRTDTPKGQKEVQQIQSQWGPRREELHVHLHDHAQREFDNTSPDQQKVSKDAAERLMDNIHSDKTAGNIGEQVKSANLVDLALLGYSKAHQWVAKVQLMRGLPPDQAVRIADALATCDYFIGGAIFIAGGGLAAFTGPAGAALIPAAFVPWASLAYLSFIEANPVANILRTHGGIGARLKQGAIAPLRVAYAAGATIKRTAERFNVESKWERRFNREARGKHGTTTGSGKRGRPGNPVVQKAREAFYAKYPQAPRTAFQNRWYNPRSERDKDGVPIWGKPEKASTESTQLDDLRILGLVSLLEDANQSTESILEPDDVDFVADANERHQGDDWFNCLLCSGFAHTGDMEEAVYLAEDAFEDAPEYQEPEAKLESAYSSFQHMPGGKVGKDDAGLTSDANRGKQLPDVPEHAEEPQKSPEEAEKIKKEYDLIRLPDDVRGTNCGNCKYIDDDKDFCEHPKIKLPVDDKHCCALWDAEGVERDWTEQIDYETELELLLEGVDHVAGVVYRQLLPDYPKSAIKWVKEVPWEGPVKVPLEQVDFDNQANWRASHEPEKVQKFIEFIKDGATKPVIMCRIEGTEKHIILDGHHRTLAFKRLNQPIIAYVATVPKREGPWGEMHASQRVSDSYLTKSETTEAAITALGKLMEDIK